MIAVVGAQKVGKQSGTRTHKKKERIRGDSDFSFTPKNQLLNGSIQKTTETQTRANPNGCPFERRTQPGNQGPFTISNKCD